MKETAREKVQSWIEGNFEQEGVEKEDWPMLPGGRILKDRKGGEMLVWWDFWEEKINYKIREEK